MRAWLLLLPACAVGAGSTTVGEWRPKRVVESEACIATGPDTCGKVIQIGREDPARSFAGGIFAFSVPGYAHASTNGAGESAFVLDGSYEYLRGRGAVALGGRVGLSLVDGSQHTWVVMPVTAMAHVGGSWGSVFAGVGYAPLVSASRTGMPTSYLHDGVEGLVGTELVLRETLGRYITVSPELRYQRAGDTTILAVTANLGLHL
jgi:hypothetical protein